MKKGIVAPGEYIIIDEKKNNVIGGGVGGSVGFSWPPSKTGGKTTSGSSRTIGPNMTQRKISTITWTDRLQQTIIQKFFDVQNLFKEGENYDPTKKDKKGRLQDLYHYDNVSICL